MAPRWLLSSLPWSCAGQSPTRALLGAAGHESQQPPPPLWCPPPVAGAGEGRPDAPPPGKPATGEGEPPGVPPWMRARGSPPAVPGRKRCHGPPNRERRCPGGRGKQGELVHDFNRRMAWCGARHGPGTDDDVHGRTEQRFAIPQLKGQRLEGAGGEWELPLAQEGSGWLYRAGGRRIRWWTVRTLMAPVRSRLTSFRPQERDKSGSGPS